MKMEEFFKYEYRPGFVRWIENDKVIYIPEKALKDLLLEDLQFVRMRK